MWILVNRWAGKVSVRSVLSLDPSCEMLLNAIVFQSEEVRSYPGVHTMRISQVLLAVLFICCTSCRQNTPEPEPESKATVDSGNLGGRSQSNSKGRWSTTLPYIHEGRNQMILGLIEAPKQPWQPAFVLFLKFNSSTAVDFTFKDEQDGDMAVLQYSYPTSTDARFPIRYRYSDAKLPVKEMLSLGGKDYAFGSGRVFLIDLSRNPVQVIQMNDPVKFSVPDGTDATTIKNHTTKKQLISLRDSLAKENKVIDRFLK